MLESGQLVDGKYRVERLLGKGGMGAVFEGYHTLVDRRVAIKVLLPEAISSEHGAQRFEREVRATGRIGNDHILEVYDVGVLPDGSRYMVSEFLDGETLADRLERGPLQPKVAAELMLQLLDGLAAAHDKGIVHRDLKPENLFILRQKAGRADFLKIIDFGISKYQLDGTSSMSMTATGAVLGTPYYLSPEQARGHRDIDHRSDLYTVGVIMYQAVVGRVPLYADNFNELLFKIALESPRPLTAVLPQIDPVFSGIVERAMSRQREDRYQSAHELGTALAQWLQLPSSGAHVPSAALSGVAPAPWSSVNTMTASRQLPTSGNFGLTTASDFRRSSPLRVVLIGAGVIGALGLSAALLFGSSSNEPSPGSAAISALPATPSAPAPRPVVVSTSEPTRAPPSDETENVPFRVPADLVTSEEDAAPLVNARTQRRSKAPRSAPPAKRAASVPAASPPVSTPPAGPSTAGPKPRRDFGY